MRQCYGCGTMESFNPTTGYLQWYFNHDLWDNMLCKDCESHYIRSPQRFRFGDKKFINRDLVRCKVCSWCGSISARLYALHHVQYDEIDKKAHVVEICQSCHAHEHNKKRSRNIIGQFI